MTPKPIIKLGSKLAGGGTGVNVGIDTGMYMGPPAPGGNPEPDMEGGGFGVELPDDEVEDANCMYAW